MELSIEKQLIPHDLGLVTLDITKLDRDNLDLLVNSLTLSGYYLFSQMVPSGGTPGFATVTLTDDESSYRFYPSEKDGVLCVELATDYGDTHLWIYCTADEAALTYFKERMDAEIAKLPLYPPVYPPAPDIPELS